jgi:hypothetical protein
VAEGTRERSQAVVEHVPVDVVDAVASPLKHLEVRRRSPTRMVATEPAKPPATTRASSTWLARCAPPGATTSCGLLVPSRLDMLMAAEPGPLRARFTSPPPVTELVTSIEPPI